MYESLIQLATEMVEQDKIVTRIPHLFQIRGWEMVYPQLKDIDCNDERFGWRAGMRIAMIQTICEDELRLV